VVPNYAEEKLGSLALLKFSAHRSAFSLARPSRPCRSLATVRGHGARGAGRGLEGMIPLTKNASGPQISSTAKRYCRSWQSLAYQLC
jgi:hypothetical protein